MSLSEATAAVMSRLHGLVVSSITARREAAAAAGDASGNIDLHDVQTRAVSTLSALDVLVPDYDELDLIKHIQSRVASLPLDFNGLSAKISDDAVAGRSRDVEALLLSVLRSPAFTSARSALLSEVDDAVALLMREAHANVGSVASILPPVTSALQPAPVLSDSPPQEHVATFDELMYLSTGPSLADIDPILANMTHKSAAASEL